MIIRDALMLLALMLLLSARQITRPILNAAANVVTFSCDDSRTVRATYLDAKRAVITLDDKSTRLTIATSACGARYTGRPRQWWAKGMRDAMLAPLKPGETIASAGGRACHAS